MKLSCSRCGQISADGHLWCQQIDCPAGNVPIVLTYGEYVGDIKIVRLLRVFRTAAIYEAERNDERLLLKIAHQDHTDILKVEAHTLKALTPYHIPGLPVLLPAYLPAGPEDPPYGKAVYRGETRYYVVFEYIPGVFLRDLLYENAEPWYRDAAWITIALSRTISALHKQGNFIHGNIHPDIILVTRDEETRVPRPTLLDLGIIYQPQDALTPDRIAQIRHHISPSYQAPEILQRGGQMALSNATDVYGLGMLLYEMLAGHQFFEAGLRSDAEIQREILASRQVQRGVVRLDVPRPKDLRDVVSRAIQYAPSDRFERVGDFRDALVQIFGDVPPPRKRSRKRNAVQVLMVIAMLATVLTVFGMLASILIG